MNRNNRVVKASNIYYINANQPGQLMQIAEEYYQRAQQCEQEYAFQKARVYYQKAEEYFQRARDAYKARRQADRAKKQADEARKQADEARKQAGEAKEQAIEGYAPQMTIYRNCKSQPAAEYNTAPISPPAYLPPPTRQQSPKPQNQASQMSLSRIPAQISRTSQQDKELPKKAVIPGSQSTDELPQPSAMQDAPDAPERKAHHPISWRGKKHG